MSTLLKSHRLLLVLIAAGAIAFAVGPVRDAVGWYDRPFAGILVDPDGLVSSFGLPTWDGFRQGLNFPDQVLEVDGERLDGRRGYHARTWDLTVASAAKAGHPSVHVRVLTGTGERELDLAISHFDSAAFWLNAGLPIAAAILYVAGALITLGASPNGRLARTFAKTTLWAAVFLFTLFDFHTTRKLVPLFHLAFAMVPMAAFALALRIPDDVEFLARRPWIVAVLDGLGLALGSAMIACQLLVGSTTGLRSLCTWLFSSSFLFFAATFLVRFARARAERRSMMRALLLAMVPAHLVLGAAFLLASTGRWGATTAFCTVPALMLTPFATIVALIRHNLWGSRALLSRVLMRVVIVAITIGVAVPLGAGMAALFNVPFGGALLAATVAGLVAALLVGPALNIGDRALFPSRAVYKPTIEQLSEELTVVAMPEEVAHAVETTVLRWLPCERVEFRPTGARAEAATQDNGIVSGIRQVRVSSPPAIPTTDPAQSDELTIDVLFRGISLAELRVGKKRGGALFTSEDVDLLRTIANQAALALSHAYSYAELELRRRQQAEAWRGEREALVETVAAEIAHEVRYPINYFRSIFHRGRDGQHLDADEVDIGCDEVERLERLVSGLRRVATRRLDRRTVPVAELIAKAERLLRDPLGHRRLIVSVRGAPEIRCDSDQITQVLVNLVSNALDAAGDDGRVGVSWTLGSQGAELVVWDSGPDFEVDAARMFAPWFTTKPRGTGLGLAITHRIVRAHGWTIDPERRDGVTRFVLAIPETDILANGSDGDPGQEVA